MLLCFFSQPALSTRPSLWEQGGCLELWLCSPITRLLERAASQEHKVSGKDTCLLSVLVSPRHPSFPGTRTWELRAQVHDHTWIITPWVQRVMGWSTSTTTSQDYPFGVGAQLACLVSFCYVSGILCSLYLKVSLSISVSVSCVYSCIHTSTHGSTYPSFHLFDGNNYLLSTVYMPVTVSGAGDKAVK